MVGLHLSLDELVYLDLSFLGFGTECGLKLCCSLLLVTIGRIRMAMIPLIVLDFSASCDTNGQWYLGLGVRECCLSEWSSPISSDEWGFTEPPKVSVLPPILTFT